MWITVLVMALIVSLEPFRIGMTVLMLNRPRPMRHLLTFLCGGFCDGNDRGSGGAVRCSARLLGSTHFTVPKVQIVIGVLLY